MWEFKLFGIRKFKKFVFNWIIRGERSEGGSWGREGKKKKTTEQTFSGESHWEKKCFFFSLVSSFRLFSLLLLWVSVFLADSLESRFNRRPAGRRKKRGGIRFLYEIPSLFSVFSALLTRTWLTHTTRWESRGKKVEIDYQGNFRQLIYSLSSKLRFINSAFQKMLSEEKKTRENFPPHFLCRSYF